VFLLFSLFIVQQLQTNTFRTRQFLVVGNILLGHIPTIRSSKYVHNVIVKSKHQQADLQNYTFSAAQFKWHEMVISNRVESHVQTLVVISGNLCRLISTAGIWIVMHALTITNQRRGALTLYEFPRNSRSRWGSSIIIIID